MWTHLKTLLQIDRPILSAPMGGAAGPDLVAAVCNAGGFGVIPLWSQPLPEVRAGIAAIRAQTDRGFAVNLNLGFDWQDRLQVCIDEGVAAVSLFWGHDPRAIETAKSAGVLVLSSVGTAAEARQAADAGADIIVAQGWEAGGHVWGQVATMALIPAVVDAVDVPVIAAGGIADGRGLAAALMLGASAGWVGTRFLASQEAAIHQTYRERVLKAGEDGTTWAHDLYDLSWPDAPHRVLTNSTTRQWQDAGSPAPGLRPQEGEVLGHRPNGDPVTRYQSYTPIDGTTGTVEAMSLWAGQGVGLARHIQRAAEIVEELDRDARRIIAAGAATFG
ncbi:nitronate monooxygenase family protein [Jannaschia sp. M317]|uniref:NAD(P)H-dependent flavin oxidoreductase n=1 Tax=Jannaschia sp. M317 TaxID=2867011 RepID=UPI0021A8C289|nr:nitronate monooxygenase [Jannaschia sp. M317]UWQ17865.1 nitronate monooxygenase [Jannaschia sp. M317]